MKLREFGYMIFVMSEKIHDEEIMGNFVYKLAPLIEDWGKDNELTDLDNINWIQESYNDWTTSK